MKIVRQTSTELVVQESALWIAAGCGLLFLVFLGLAVARRSWSEGVLSLVILVLVLPWLRRSTFVFDAGAQTIRWKRLRYFRTAAGTIAFSDVQGVNLESAAGGASGATYRLTIATPQGIIPMSDVYSSHEAGIAAVRDTIVQFVKPQARPAPAPADGNLDEQHAAELDASIRALLAQGRKVDAILLVQRTDHLDLTEATYRVNRIANQSKSQPLGQ